MKKNGNYLAGNSPTVKRNKGDFYQTPYHCTRLLLDNVQFSGSILEPAMGEGAILKVIAEKYRSQGAKLIAGYDIAIDSRNDFLLETNRWDNIITNPPYRLANKFILKAKELTDEKIALLLPLNYLQGYERYNTIFQDKKFPLQYVMPFTRYLMMSDVVREDGKCCHGMIAFAWYVWNSCYIGEPIIKWLDNNEFIVGKNSAEP